MSSMTQAIRCQDLVKRYEGRPPVEAVRGLNLSVEAGECFGLLGPNGAGKTTTIEILEGLLPPTSGDVELLFLDEPTTGLDPQSRRQLWTLIRSFREQGRTVLLTTHYMDEAERLCDRVAVVDHGSVIAFGSPRELIARLGGDHVIEFAVADGQSLPAPASLEDLPGVRSARAEEDGGLGLRVTEPHLALPALLDRLRQHGLDLARLTTRHASLEDVFVQLTGRHLREE